ncbi:MAG: hypothetical protein FWD85_13690 [Microbacteriaceae bacterium]|nr:hypothetical protein [Microbacteriaceae bacterium]
MNYERLDEYQQLALAISDDIEARFMIAGIEELPLSVQLVLITDPNESVRGGIAVPRGRDRLAVRLGEQRERHPGIREALALQTYASVSLKRTAPLHLLFENAVRVALDDLGLPPERMEEIVTRWNAARRSESGETFGHFLDRI